MIKYFLIKDPLTLKRSLTVTMLVLSFVLMVTCLILFLTQDLTDVKIGLLFLMVWGTTLAIYQQKRIRINFTGIEMSDEIKGDQNAKA